MVKTHCCGLGSIPGQGTKIPQPVAWPQKKKKKTVCRWPETGSCAFRVATLGTGGYHNCCCSVGQSLLTLCDAMDYSPPGSSVHGLLQARKLGWVAISFSNHNRGSHLKPVKGQFQTLEKGFFWGSWFVSLTSVACYKPGLNLKPVPWSQLHRTCTMTWIISNTMSLKFSYSHKSKGKFWFRGTGLSLSPSISTKFPHSL